MTKRGSTKIFRETRPGLYFKSGMRGAQDEKLSWAARGLWSYLQSKPSDWEVSLADLRRQGNVGRDVLRRLLNELEKQGYVSRSVRGEHGLFDHEIIVYGSPDLNPFYGNKVEAQRTPENQSPVNALPAPESQSPGKDSPPPEIQAPVVVGPSPESPSPDLPSPDFQAVNKEEILQRKDHEERKEEEWYERHPPAGSEREILVR